jgi:hypothetical protein
MVTRLEEAQFERKAEADLQGHRQAPDGRNVFAFRMRDLDNLNYRERFSRTFPDAPGEPWWFQKRFCSRCDHLKTQCVCGTGKEFQKEVRFMAPRGARVK